MSDGNDFASFRVVNIHQKCSVLKFCDSLHRRSQDFHCGGTPIGSHKCSFIVNKYSVQRGYGMGRGLSPLPRKFLSFFSLDMVYSSAFLSVQCNSSHWTDIKSLECMSVCVCVCVCLCVCVSAQIFRPRQRPQFLSDDPQI